MPVVAVIVPGAVTAGNAISLTSGLPKIGQIISATIVSLTEGTPNTFTTASATATKVSDTSFALDTDTTASDFVILVYSPVTEYVAP